MVIAEVVENADQSSFLCCYLLLFFTIEWYLVRLCFDICGLFGADCLSKVPCLLNVEAATATTGIIHPIT